ESKVALDFGAFYTYGGNAEYLKMAKSEHDHSSMDVKSRMYYVQFQNIPTGEIHEHALGVIHETPTTMLEFRLGIQVKLD
ncbi:MAG TPA: hypothetical protein VEB42_01195, partial [Chitinophagaceae bacterium]|nr:hypothetical protein [Chitinophagaceae bacterium]